MRTQKNQNVSKDNSIRLRGKKSIKPRTFEGVQKRKHRRKPGTVALRQIRHYQETTNLLLPNAPFLRLIREIALEVMGNQPLLWQKAAVEALQEIAEAFMVSMFEDANYAAIHAKRVTVRPEDLRIVRKLRRDKE